MSVRAKFTVESKQSAGEEYGGAQTVRMHAVYSSDPNHPNHQWWQATPSGEITLSILNAKAAEQFTAGAEYYVEFTAAE